MNFLIVAAFYIQGPKSLITLSCHVTGRKKYFAVSLPQGKNTSPLHLHADDAKKMNRPACSDNISVKGKNSLTKNVQEETIVTRQEFAELIETEGKNIYAFCYHLTGNRDNADELYQETMLKAIERQEKIESAGNPKNYLLGIAVGNWKNQKKKYARRQRIAPQEHGDETWDFPEAPQMSSPEEAYLSAELAALVRMETASLKEKYRIPVYLYYSQEMSIEEIARTLHIPRGTVKSRLYTARTMIAERLEEHGYANEQKV